MRFGIDLGGTKTEIIALDESGTEIYRKRENTDPSSYEAIVATLTKLVTEAELTLGQSGTVGVGIPGTISAQTGCVKNAKADAAPDRQPRWLFGSSSVTDASLVGELHLLAGVRVPGADRPFEVPRSLQVIEVSSV